MNRAMRREAYQEAVRGNKRIIKHSSATRPLRYYGGYVHRKCGSPAEMPNNWAAGGYCSKCGPCSVRELERG